MNEKTACACCKSCVMLKHMKHVVSLLMIALCASALQAVGVNLISPSALGESVYSDGTSIVSGEKIALIGIPTSALTTYLTTHTYADIEDEIAVDCFGTISTTGDLATALANVTILHFASDLDTTQLTIATTQAGYWGTTTKNWSVSAATEAFTAWQNNELTTTATYYLFAIRYDTRAVSVSDTDGAVSITAGGDFVSEYAVSAVLRLNSYSSSSDLTLAETLSSNTTLYTISALFTLIDPYILPTTASDFRATTLPTSYTVDGTVYEGDAVANLFAPQVGTMTMVANSSTTSSSTGSETSSRTLTLTIATDASGNLLNVSGTALPSANQLYSLYTTTSLSGTWELFDAVLEEKGIDAENDFGYTRLQMDQLGTLSVPIFDSDSARFYRISIYP